MRPNFVPLAHSALIVVDVQNDFCPGGALAIKHGDRVVPVLNRYIEACRSAGRPIFFTRDWHPVGAKHFETWPPHCVANTPGADFHPDLLVPERAHIITKGDDPIGDAYSGFEGHDEYGVPLEALLKHLGITHLYVGGLATDYCVKATVLSARELKFSVDVLPNANRAVELAPGDESKALKAMLDAGAFMGARSR